MEVNLNELTRLTRMVEKRGCVYRLKGWEAGRWDYLGTRDIAIMRRFLETRQPEAIEMLVNLETLKDPRFKLPY